LIDNMGWRWAQAHHRPDGSLIASASNVSAPNSKAQPDGTLIKALTRAWR
jgi:hypothetical protein